MPPPSTEAFRVKDLIAAPKPPFFASGRTTKPGGAVRSFRAIFDGRDTWFIERPGQAEMKAGGRTVVVRAHEVDVFDVGVSTNNDVKVALDGRRMAYLEAASLEDLGSEMVAGHHCRHVRGLGLRRGDDAALDLFVEEETGAVLKILRDGTALLVVSEFRVGREEVPTG